MTTLDQVGYVDFDFHLLHFASSVAAFIPFYGKEWRSHFLTTAFLQDLLQQIGIDEHMSYRLHTGVNIGVNRCQAILSREDTDGNQLGKIVIDARIGSPTWEQFIDVTYGVDEDVDTRIIVYDRGIVFGDVSRSELDENIPRDPETLRTLVGRNRDEDTLKTRYDLDEEVPRFPGTILNLVRRNNRCGVDTYIVGAFCPCIEEMEPTIRYLSLDSVREEAGIHDETLPSREQVELAEFWLEYYRCFHPIYEEDIIPPSEDIIGESAPVSCSEWYINTEVTWDEDGIIVRFVPYSHHNSESEIREGERNLHRVWDEKRMLLGGVYWGAAKFIDKDETPLSISVELNGTSAEYCGQLPESTKMCLAEMIANLEYLFDHLVYEVLCENNT